MADSKQVPATVELLGSRRAVGLVAAADVDQPVADGSKETFLAGLVATSLVLLDHPLPLLLEVAHYVLPELHVEDGGLEAGPGHSRTSRISSGCWTCCRRRCRPACGRWEQRDLSCRTCCHQSCSA